MTNIIDRVTLETRSFLEAKLPALSDNWWQDMVLTALNTQQKDILLGSQEMTLNSLDLVALLLVFDQNWSCISEHMGYYPEQRQYLKEMLSIVNRMGCHISTYVSDEELYSDLDTVQGLLKMIAADKNLINDIQKQKQKVSKGSTEQRIQVSGDKSAEGFQPGQLVRLKSSPDKQYAVVSILIREPENRVDVFGEAGHQSFYESQLEIVPQKTLKQINLDEFNATISALQIRQPNLTTLYSLNSARIDFIPYQFRPVMKFIRSDRPRLLIADSVGVGKTIEAGLILKELQARKELGSVLIVCPRPLVTERKWLDEMKRFDETFRQLDGKQFELCIEECHLDEKWPQDYRRSIIPYSLFNEARLHGEIKRGKRKRGLLDLDPPPHFDLVIVDEAHHIRNTDTCAYKTVSYLCNNADAVVFLTATPVQTKSEDLFVLLNTLRPDLIIDRNSYETMMEPNQYITQAVKYIRQNLPGWQQRASDALTQIETTEWGRLVAQNNPLYKSAIEGLKQEPMTNEQRVKLISQVEEIHTLSGVINRTRRRDIGSIVIRKPETVMVRFTPEQELIHDEVLNVQRRILEQTNGDIPINFLMSTIRRQAASCIFGLLPLLNDTLNRNLDEALWDDPLSIMPDIEVGQSLKADVDALIDLASQVPGRDPKLEALLKVLHEKQSLPNNKVMVFSSFIHTLKYLDNHLQAAGIRVGLIYGGVDDEGRLELRRRFQLPKEEPDSLDVMLFSEVGCEGLDYQFCDTMVNYDLPWNPMRIEQRIGRIDRKGQKSEKVLIYNMITEGTIDHDIYDRCLMRIGIFEHSIGDSEEILGDLADSIKSIAENFKITDEERKLKLQQLADNKLRKMQEEEKLEQQQYELFGIEIPLKQTEQEIQSASSYWLAPKMLEHLVEFYLNQRLGTQHQYILGDKEPKTLRLSQEARNIILRDYKSMSLTSNPIGRAWENWLKETKLYLSITFSAEYASIDDKVVLINAFHPIVKQAAHHLAGHDFPYTELQVVDPNIPSGDYNFVIYKWETKGIRNDLALKPICSDSRVGSQLINLIESASDSQINVHPEPDYWDHLESQHYELWKQEKHKHIDRTIEVAEYKKQSLKTSHQALVASVIDRMKQVTDEKILRMYRSQLASLQAAHERNIQELDIAVEKADIVTTPVMYGIIRISREEV
ncbi:MAG TPA: SNF2-related protein [Candidatus Cloacimonadota bacterium]|nr:SNF2-related protein [Candidatus Cloacimonadota bacterium]